MLSSIVSIKFDQGPSIDVPFIAGMNGEDALKKAFELLNAQAPNSCSYAVTYYGQQLGYLVSMINGTYDSFNSKFAPFFYWEIYCNGNPASVGIDGLKLNARDILIFKFETYNAAAHAKSTLKKKNDAQLKS